LRSVGLNASWQGTAEYPILVKGIRSQPLKGVMLCTLFGLPESSM